jgi:hypothetical protein
MQHHDTIQSATSIRCVDEQLLSRQATRDAAYYIAKGLLGRAAQEQREAAYHHTQMWMRLARLIGVA